MKESEHVTVTLPKAEYDALVKLAQDGEKAGDVRARRVVDNILRTLANMSGDARYFRAGPGDIADLLERSKEVLLK